MKIIDNSCTFAYFRFKGHGTVKEHYIARAHTNYVISAVAEVTYLL